uniref:Rhodanese domain-containing protein n=1 Tax=Meloidogyne hapla TaxID=6305 RepID=A0A1I8BHV1_MELHA
MPVVTENPKEESSSTIINLGEGEKEENKIIEEIITTTTSSPTEGEQTETITPEPKEEKKEEGKKEETTEEPKSEKQEGEEKEEGKKAKGEEEAKEEEKKPEEEITITTTPIIETTTLEEEQNNLDEEELIKLMTEALKRSNLAIQNVTLILPGDTNPTLLQTFLQTLLTNNKPLNEQQNILPTPLFPSNQFWPPAANILPAVYTSSIISSSVPQQRPTRPSYLIKVEQLNDWIKSGKNIKILDASYDPEPLPIDHIKFYSDYYAKWDKLLLEKRNLQYERSHLENSIPFNLNIATYPSWNERQSLYSPELFQQYIQRLGIDQNDQLVIYGRGPNGGMLQSARVWFLFRLGNWTATFRDDLLSTFEELTTADNYGYCILSRLYWYNFIDARPRNEFFGLSGLYETQRGHLSGSKPFPADELVTPKGFLLSTVEILKKLTQIGYNRNYQTIVFGNTADEASLILLALALIQDTKAKLYNGGVEEIKRRAPYLISLK